uniref:Proliferating cell nuclear antigen n=1 Tax=Pithovirus LCPAC101 TaxID=2506586 RepID=A0A481Z273_9VIRU|nr:MAG: proliferating cell nuclear antigen [Pithovirus LCPAC101]
MDPYKQIIEDSGISSTFEDDTSFSATFHNGYGFRSLIEYAKSINKECEIIFDNEGIRFSKSDPDGKIMIDVIIASEELVYYNYSSSLEEYIVSFPLDILEKNVKQVTKKKSIRLFKKVGSPDIYMQHLTSYNQITMDEKEIQTLSYDQTKITQPPPPEYYIRDHIVAIPIHNFSMLCKEYCTCTCDGVMINISKKMVRLEGKSSKKISNADEKNLIIRRYYNYENSNRNLSLEEIEKLDNTGMYSVYIPINRIKCFSKLSIASENGIIKFYRPTDDIIKISKEKDKVVPIKMMCNLSNYGLAYIYTS